MGSGCHRQTWATHTRGGKIETNCTFLSASPFIALPENNKYLRIVKGNAATRGQFPHQISLQFSSSRTNFEHVCGGTIVSSTAIVTAAHCLVLGPSDLYRVVAGILNLNDSNAARQNVDVSYYTRHPQYNSQFL